MAATFITHGQLLVSSFFKPQIKARGTQKKVKEIFSLAHRLINLTYNKVQVQQTKNIQIPLIYSLLLLLLLFFFFKYNVWPSRTGGFILVTLIKALL